MVRQIDHVTVAARDADAGLRVLGLLGSREVKSVVIKGGPFAEYMGVPDIEAEHRVAVAVEIQRQRQAHVAEAEDTDGGLLAVNAVESGHGEIMNDELRGCLNYDFI